MDPRIFKILVQEISNELSSTADKVAVVRQLIFMYKNEIKAIGKEPRKAGLLDLVRRLDEYVRIK